MSSEAGQGGWAMCEVLQGRALQSTQSNALAGFLQALAELVVHRASSLILVRT